MSNDDLIRAVTNAVEAFLKEQPNLLALGAHEQAISHRIALYLEPFFQKHPDPLRADCEYNKHGDLGKTINLSGMCAEEFSSCGCSACRELVKNGQFAPVLEDKLVRPDIIVHQRKEDENNLLVIEIKKDKKCPFDKEKLKALVRAKRNGGGYGYQLGVFIYFPNDKPVYEWFVAD